MERQTAIIRIPLDRLFAHPENPNRMSRGNFEKLKRHIGQSHNYEPVVVRKHPDIEGAFEIINGHHRVRALGELGESFADCVEWQLDDEQARVLLATLNRLGGKDELAAKVGLIKNLSEKFSSKELAKLLPDTRAVIEKLKNVEAQNEFEISDLKFEMPCSLVFFLDAEQMEIVEAAIDKAMASEKKLFLATEDTEITEINRYKGTNAEKRARAITRIAEEWMMGIEK